MMCPSTMRHLCWLHQFWDLSASLSTVLVEVGYMCVYVCDHVFSQTHTFTEEIYPAYLNRRLGETRSIHINQTEALFAWVYQLKSVSHGTIFFSHNKSASAKNTASRTKPHHMLLIPQLDESTVWRKQIVSDEMWSHIWSHRSRMRRNALITW
jgi:hypothetical protein